MLPNFSNKNTLNEHIVNIKWLSKDPVCDVSRNYLTVIFCLIVSRYKILRDPAGWLSVDKETGLIKVKSLMDRESSFVKDNKYTALISAYDNGRCEQATHFYTLMSKQVIHVWLLSYCFPITNFILLSWCVFVYVCHQMKFQPPELVL